MSISKKTATDIENVQQFTTSLIDCLQNGYTIGNITNILKHYISMKDFFNVHIKAELIRKSDNTIDKICPIVEQIDNGKVNKLAINISWFYILIGLYNKKIKINDINKNPELKYIVNAYEYIQIIRNRGLSSIKMKDIDTVVTLIQCDNIVNTKTYKLSRYLYAIEYMFALYIFEYTQSRLFYIIWYLKSLVITIIPFIVLWIFYLLMCQFKSLLFLEFSTLSSYVAVEIFAIGIICYFYYTFTYYMDNLINIIAKVHSNIKYNSKDNIEEINSDNDNNDNNDTDSNF